MKNVKNANFKKIGEGPFLSFSINFNSTNLNILYKFVIPQLGKESESAVTYTQMKMTWPIQYNIDVLKLWPTEHISSCLQKEKETQFQMFLANSYHGPMETWHFLLQIQDSSC